MQIYLLLGSNLGDRMHYIRAARNTLTCRLGPIVKQSKVYESEPWRSMRQADYLNQVLRINSKVSVQKLLSICLDIEKKLGRVRMKRYSSRIIDIDILYYGRQRLQSKGLEIPHPAIAHRRFTLLPLTEISPTFKHPILKQEHKNLLKACGDPCSVWPYQT